jgi:hypothetical protein
MDTDFEIYKNKKFSSLLKDVVVNSEQKRGQIDVLISELRILIKSPQDAISIVPLIKEYLDVGVKNDEQLVKLAAIVQRLASTQTSSEEGGGFGITDEERKALMAEATKLTEEINKPVDVKQVEPSN